ncbi:MAG TPA: hypothetical protein VJ836_07165 [Candidatus Saccharimonadales bacterium]|nr:hypothetical protein [Candidatus Saccharimonadales bacterium]
MLYLFEYFAAVSCKPKAGFFGIPPWYQYLDKYITYNTNSKACEFNTNFISSSGLRLDYLILAGLGIIDILLRVAALVAVGYIMYAGVLYVTSQGEPDKAKRALGTIVNALAGLAITIVAAASVSFIGNALSR